MLSEARRYVAAAKKERADRYSANVPVIREIQESGAPSRLGDYGPLITRVTQLRSVTAQQSSGTAMRESRSPA